MAERARRESATVWTCIGQVDEFHPFCPFATRHPERAEEHNKIPGHHVIAEYVPGEWPLSKLQLDALAQEAARDA